MKQKQIEGFRLSPQQKSLWLCQQKNPSPYYQTQGAIFLEGALAEDRLITALETVIKRQEILRTIFYKPQETNSPLQVILDSNACPFKRSIHNPGTLIINQCCSLDNWTKDRCQRGYFSRLKGCRNI